MIKKIYHLADLHVRLVTRMQEYQKVFKNTIKEISKDTEDAIVVLAGDIIHTKTELSPEMIQLVSNFLKSLAELLPVIIIAGNHDANTHNKNRMDALTPIISAINNSNIYYYRNTGVYKFKNLSFGVTSVFDKKIITADKLPDNKTKIALYHGIINNSSIDTGFILKDDKFIKSIFDGYDMVLLGDIHKLQCLQIYENNKPEIWYCGSLIQQNFGEDVKHHGLLKWDIKKRKPEFINIDNDYGYVTLDIKNGILQNDNIFIPKKPRIRIRSDYNTTNKEISKLISKLRKKHTIQEILTNRNIDIDNTGVDNINMNIIENISSAEYQNQLIEDFINDNSNIDISKEGLNFIKELNVRINDKVEYSSSKLFANVNWKLKRMEFDNMFSYGTGNVIDFENLHNCVGIFGENHSGKSSIIDVLLFCLFDKTSKTSRGDHILNKKESDLYCKLIFEFNGEEYHIIKIGEKKYSYQDKREAVSVDIDFYKYDLHGNKISLKGEDRNGTNKNIRAYIGEYEDFIDTVTSIQNDSFGFINLSHANRKDFLNRLLKINIFDNLYKEANDEYKYNKIKLNQLVKENPNIIIEEAKEKLETLNVKYKENLIKRNKLKEKIKYYQNSLLQKTKTLKEIDSSVSDLDIVKLKDLINNCSEEEYIKCEELKRVEHILDQLKGQLQSYIDKFNILKNSNIEKKYNNYIDLISQRNKLEQNLNEKKINLKHKQEELNKLGQLEYDPNCKYCMNNIFVKSAIKTKEEIKTYVDETDNLINQKQKIDNLIEEYKSIKNNHDLLIEYKDNISNYKDKISTYVEKKYKLNPEIENLIDVININEKKILKYNKFKEDIEFNEKINSKISDVELKIDELEREYDIKDNNTQTSKTNLKLTEFQIKELEQKIKSIDKLEKETKLYEIYISCISRNGIPYHIITKVAPIVEETINDILSLICKFNVKFDLEEKNINISITYNNLDYWPVEISSGFEKFIISIAIRVALLKISNLSKPNFMIIDEGFGSFDANNLNSLKSIFNYLKEKFQFVIIITHLDQIKSEVDKIIDISIEDDYSIINT